MKKGILSLSILLLAAGATGTAWAQAGNAAQQPPASQAAKQAQLPASSDVSDQEVAQFAKAQKQVRDIKADYREKVQAHSKEPQKAMKVQRQAQQKMVKAVKDTGMGVRRYNQIAQAAQRDNDLRQRIQEQD